MHSQSKLEKNRAHKVLDWMDWIGGSRLRVSKAPRCDKGLRPSIDLATSLLTCSCFCSSRVGVNVKHTLRARKHRKIVFMLRHFSCGEEKGETGVRWEGGTPRFRSRFQVLGPLFFYFFFFFSIRRVSVSGVGGHLHRIDSSRQFTRFLLHLYIERQRRLNSLLFFSSARPRREVFTFTHASYFMLSTPSRQPRPHSRLQSALHLPPRQPAVQRWQAPMSKLSRIIPARNVSVRVKGRHKDGMEGRRRDGMEE